MCVLCPFHFIDIEAKKSRSGFPHKEVYNIMHIAHTVIETTLVEDKTLRKIRKKDNDVIEYTHEEGYQVIFRVRKKVFSI